LKTHSVLKSEKVNEEMARTIDFEGDKKMEELDYVLKKSKT
jgi:hypothetical protein